MRLCDLNDLDFCYDIAQKFGVMAGHEIDRDQLNMFLIRMMDEGTIIRSEKGVIGGLIFEFYMSGETVCQEFFWYSEGGDGVELLQEFEKLVKSKGAKRLIMSTLSNEYQPKINKILGDNGYTPFEHSLVRDL